MAAIGDFAKESVKRLGPGAYLVNVLPSAVIVLTVWALFASHLLPWEPRRPDEGAAAVVQSARDLGVAGGIVLAVTVLIVAVLLRPFQISAVQVLEGYWRSRLGLRPFEPLAVERQVRNADAHQVWSRYDGDESLARDACFEVVARHSKWQHRRSRKARAGKHALKTYPEDREVFLPTKLGNTLRRAETTAGDRYGLKTVVVYPRLYPHLSPAMNNVIGNRLDLIDTMCTFVFVFVALAGATTPLAWRLDGWSVFPLVFLVFAGVSHRGARSVAERYIVSLCTAFDLHRFAMLRGLHRRLPRSPEAELIENQELSRFLEEDKPWPKETRRAYDHGD